LQRDPYAHLSACNGDNGIEKIEVGQLSIYAVVHDVNGLEAVIEGVVDYYCTLEGSAFEGKRVDRRRLVCVMVGVNPGLGAGFAVWCYDEYDIFRP
jgi:hypothetical protein